MARKSPMAASQMRKTDMPYDTQGMDPEMAQTLMGESRRKAAVQRLTNPGSVVSTPKPKETWQQGIHRRIRQMLGLGSE